MDADIIIVGGGLAGLVAAHELTRAGRRVALVDQENPSNLGGQAFRSFGGVFLVDLPEQRRLRVRDSFELGGATGGAAQDGIGWTASWPKMNGPSAGAAPILSLGR